MKPAIFSLILLFFCFSCNSHKTSDPVPLNESLPEVVSDSDANDTMPDPPKAADGLFDDFIYSFMRISRFQRERIVFPLKHLVYGKETKIEKQQWKHDYLYVKKDVYTLIFDDKKSLKAEKDTSLHQVVVEMINLKKLLIKNYRFEKLDGQWMLTCIDEQNVADNVNCDFLKFYAQFSTSSKYQSTHILNPFEFKTYDYENFQDIEGVLDVEQWPDYRPTLPHGIITNINYGQQYANSNRRVLMVCSQSGGMGCSLFFVKKGGSWKLSRLEN